MLKKNLLIVLNDRHYLRENITPMTKSYRPFRLSIAFCLVFFLLTGAATDVVAQSSIYTKIISISGPKNNEKRDSTFSEVKDATFTISLHSMNQGAQYSAQRAIHRSKITEEYKWITLYLATDKGDDIAFKDAADFMRYMEEHGYKLDSETKQRYSTDYVFSKK
jgi:pterin-4a-carbinolamine dehydratase